MLSKINRSNLLAKTLLRQGQRTFAAQGQLTDELKDHLKRLGITKHHNVVQNPT